MNLLKPKNLEERIAASLIDGSLKTTDLLNRLEIGGKKPTKQGFYAALRRLKIDDVVVVYKGVVALNVTWAKQVGQALDRIHAAYGGESSDILALKDKESVSYNFSTIQQLDNYWGHIQDIVVRATPATEPVYTYDPHYWFYIARPEVEKAHITLVNSLNKQFLMTVEGKTPLDKALLPEFNNEMRQYHMEKIFDKAGYYAVVVGDYIFEARFDTETERQIEAVYAQHTSLSAEAISELAQVPAIAVRTRLKVSRNSTRARKLKKRLSKNFFISH